LHIVDNLAVKEKKFELNYLRLSEVILISICCWAW